MIRNSENPLIDDLVEVAVLRSMIDEPIAARVACERLNGLSFGVYGRGVLFVVLRRMAQDGGINELSIHGRIAAQKRPEDQRHAADALQETEDTTALGHAHNIEVHCARLVALAARRTAFKKAEELRVKALDQSTDIAREFTESAAKIEKQSGRNIVVGTFEGLNKELEDAKHGRRYAVPFPWPRLSAATNALLPGTLTAICGTPGASKSLMVNQCLLDWHRQHKCASLVLEDGVTYHMRRALAQLAEESDVTSDEWCRRYPGSLDEMSRIYADELNAFGKCLYEVERGERPTVDYTIEWIAARAREGCRIICVDPITMVETQGKPWLIEEFICRAKAVAEQYKTSLLVVTHPRKRNADDRDSISMDDLAGSAAVQRFGQCILWLQAHGLEALPIERLDENEQPIHQHFPAEKSELNFQECNRTIVILKARNSWGGGDRVGFFFDTSSLKLVERGMVVKDSRQSA